jgi:hypothetical protein
MDRHVPERSAFGNAPKTAFARRLVNSSIEGLIGYLLGRLLEIVTTWSGVHIETLPLWGPIESVTGNVAASELAPLLISGLMFTARFRVSATRLLRSMAVVVLVWLLVVALPPLFPILATFAARALLGIMALLAVIGLIYLVRDLVDVASVGRRVSEQGNSEANGGVWWEYPDIEDEVQPREREHPYDEVGWLMEHLESLRPDKSD